MGNRVELTVVVAVCVKWIGGSVCLMMKSRSQGNGSVSFWKCNLCPGITWHRRLAWHSRIVESLKHDGTAANRIVCNESGLSCRHMAKGRSKWTIMFLMVFPQSLRQNSAQCQEFCIHRMIEWLVWQPFRPSIIRISRPVCSGDSSTLSMNHLRLWFFNCSPQYWLVIVEWFEKFIR